MMVATRSEFMAVTIYSIPHTLTPQPLVSRPPILKLRLSTRSVAVTIYSRPNTLKEAPKPLDPGPPTLNLQL